MCWTFEDETRTSSCAWETPGCEFWLVSRPVIQKYFPQRYGGIKRVSGWLLFRLLWGKAGDGVPTPSDFPWWYDGQCPFLSSSVLFIHCSSPFLLLLSRLSELLYFPCLSGSSVKYTFLSSILLLLPLIRTNTFFFFITDSSVVSTVIWTWGKK